MLDEAGKYSSTGALSLSNVNAADSNTHDDSQQQFPPQRICTIKMFLLLFLQHILLTFSCSYVSKKWDKNDDRTITYG